MTVSAVSVFAVQLLYIALLGVQSRNVRDGQYKAAAATSLMLGCAGVFITPAIVRAAVIQQDPATLAGYILAGPVGICLGIFTHEKLSGINKRFFPLRLRSRAGFASCIVLGRLGVLAENLLGRLRYQASDSGDAMTEKRLPHSGAMTGFQTGAVRDAAGGKGLPSCIPLTAFLRFARRYEDGQTNYPNDPETGLPNWMKGIPLSRYQDAMMRHAMQWAAGDTSEDHLSAVMWNAAGAAWTEEQIRAGKLPAELEDLPYRIFARLQESE